MLVTFGQGELRVDGKEYAGQILLDEHKLFMRGAQGDLAPTFVPVEKICRLRSIRAGLRLEVRPALLQRYQVVLRGQRREMGELVRELVGRRCLKKRWWLKEWIDPAC